MGSTDCHTAAKSVGLAENAKDPRIADDQISASSLLSHTHTSKLRLSYADQGTCLENGATYIEIDFKNTVSVYAFIFGGT